MLRRSGSMSGEWKRTMVRTVGHRQTKGPATVMPHLPHRATPRLYYCLLASPGETPCDDGQIVGREPPLQTYLSHQAFPVRPRYYARE
jgi:hypothetical protein